MEAQKYFAETERCGWWLVAGGGFCWGGSIQSFAVGPLAMLSVLVALRIFGAAAGRVGLVKTPSLKAEVHV